MGAENIQSEWLKCSHSPLYFVHNYCFVEDATAGQWVKFELWPEQARTLKTLLNNLLVVILKARQLGFSWLVLAFALWLMLFRPAATILIFSRRDDEATHLLTDRLKKMYDRLPLWMQARAVVEDNDHEWQLSNGSVARAFPTTAGDSYTASLVIVDEADLIADLNKLVNAVKPTIDNGGRMIMLSRSDKSNPESEFKRIYRAAKQKLTKWVAVFVPWHAHPGRGPVWYAEQEADSLHRTGSLDDLHQQYPASDTEALSPRTLDKRIAPKWLEQCFVELPGLADLPKEAPAIPGLIIYRWPRPGTQYVVGGDPAEGNPTSDDSALTVLDAGTGEEVAKLAGKFEPSTLAAHIDAVGRYYNNAKAMVERNNHGHAVLLWLREHSPLERLLGRDGKEGWLSSVVGKTVMYDATADAFRDEETILHSFDTFTQLSSIEGSTLRAPEGQMDDKADSYALAIVGRPKVLTGSLVV